MGAETFTMLASGVTADKAFRSAVDQARYDHGHSGYTGTIAEKDSFVLLVPPVPQHELIKAAPDWFGYDNNDPMWQQVDDKWGPAGCIDLGGDRFLFFGWASS